MIEKYTFYYRQLSIKYNRKGLNEWVAIFSVLQQCYPMTICDDGNVFVYTAAEKLIFKFQLNVNSRMWILATILDRAGEQEAKKEKVGLNLKGSISLASVEEFLEN